MQDQLELLGAHTHTHTRLPGLLLHRNLRRPDNAPAILPSALQNELLAARQAPVAEAALRGVDGARRRHRGPGPGPALDARPVRLVRGRERSGVHLEVGLGVAAAAASRAAAAQAAGPCRRASHSRGRAGA
jgi:hypothetical protein